MLFIYLLIIGTILSVCLTFIMPLLSSVVVRRNWFLFTGSMVSILSFLIGINSFVIGDFAVQFNAGDIVGKLLIQVDKLSGWFLIMVGITGLLGTFYSSSYLSRYSDSRKLNFHMPLIPIFLVSMVWVLIIQSAIGFLVAWEIMSLSSFLLILFDYKERETVKAAINYFVQMHISVVLLTVGFLWASSLSGSFLFNTFSDGVVSMTPGLNLLLFLVFFAGFGIKAGFVPFHTWLPHAHPAAPAHVSGLMSGLIVKMGLYGILRMIFALHPDFVVVGYIVFIVGLVTSLYGIILASQQDNIKKLLAYSTIENMGIMGLGIGMGLLGIGYQNTLLSMAGFGGALLHAFNHSLFKPVLFFASGAIYQQTHTLSLNKLGGLQKMMPRLGMIFLFGSLAISALPPLNGFVSEFIIYSGMVGSLRELEPITTLTLALGLFGLSLAGGIAIFTFTKAYGIAFLGLERTPHNKPLKDIGSGMLIPLAVLLSLCLIIGVLPYFLVFPATDVVSQLLNPLSIPVRLEELPMFDSLIGITTIALVLGGVFLVLWLMRRNATSKTVQEVNDTWGCGYTVESAKIQYTSTSYAKNLKKIVEPVLSVHKEKDTISSVFPSSVTYKTSMGDRLEDSLVKRPVKGVRMFLHRLGFLQNGQTQLYLLYGFLFMVGVFVFIYLKTWVIDLFNFLIAN